MSMLNPIVPVVMAIDPSALDLDKVERQTGSGQEQPVSTILEPPYRATMPAFVSFIAERFGSAQAIVRDGNRLTFSELEQRSALVAKALLALGCTKGTRIGILLPPSPEFVVFLLAAGRIGAVAAPLSTLYQAPELRWVLPNAEIDYLIVTDSFLRHDYLSRLEDALPDLATAGSGPLFLESAPRLRAIYVAGETGGKAWARRTADLMQGSDAISDAMLQAVEALVTPADPCLLVHTSGSTANPKGVIHGNGPLVRHTWQMTHDFSPLGSGERIASPRALFWVAGLVATLLYALQRGNCLICVSDGSPGAMVELIRREGVTALGGDHSWFDVLRESDEFRAAGYDVCRLSMDTAGIVQEGRFASPQLTDRFGPPVHHPHSRFARSYGMTETLGAHTSAQWNEFLPDELPSWQGRAVSGVELKIVDPQTRQPAQLGDVGELLVRGYCLMLGLNGKERHDVFDAEGFYSTGDLCRLNADGYLKFESRLGEMIKVRGASVAPLEVELAMAGLMGIEKVAVVGLFDLVDATLVAAVVMSPGRTLDEAAVMAELRNRLSSFKVPQHIVALSEHDMPLTGSGKIKKAELAELLTARFGPTAAD